MFYIKLSKNSFNLELLGFRSLPLNFLYKMHKSPIFRSFFIALYKILFYNYSR